MPDQLLFELAPEAALLEPGQNVPEKVRIQGTNQSWFALAYDPSTSERALFILPLPRQDLFGDLGNDAEVRLHWTTSAGSGDVVWAIAAAVVEQGDDVDKAMSAETESAPVTVNAAGKDWLSTVALSNLFAALPASTKSGRLIVRVRRKTAGIGSPVAADVHLLKSQVTNSVTSALEQQLYNNTDPAKGAVLVRFERGGVLAFFTGDTVRAALQQLATSYPAVQVVAADAGGYFVTDNLEAITQALGLLWSRLQTGVAGGDGAAMVKINDPGNYFLNSSVEAVLQEVGGWVPNGFGWGRRLSWISANQYPNTAQFDSIPGCQWESQGTINEHFWANDPSPGIITMTHSTLANAGYYRAREVIGGTRPIHVQCTLQVNAVQYNTDDSGVGIIIRRDDGSFIELHFIKDGAGNECLAIWDGAGARTANASYLAATVVQLPNTFTGALRTYDIYWEPGAGPTPLPQASVGRVWVLQNGTQVYDYYDTGAAIPAAAAGASEASWGQISAPGAAGFQSQWTKMDVRL